jgi:hypothetical protein
MIRFIVEERRHQRRVYRDVLIYAALEAPLFHGYAI